jgi:prepilin-type N-terminal cleavage/methylation domain-containing protein
MRRIPDSPRRSRPGFTLIELLVVIAIIAVLMGLLLGGVMRVRDRMHEVQMRSDISQLAAAITQFQFEYHVDYVPSRIRLRNDGNYFSASADQLDADSIRYLKRVWPRLQFPVRWFPDDTVATNATFYHLTGDQCLVFFLGGIQTGGIAGTPCVCNGFSVNASNPTQAGGSRKQLFDFAAARLSPVLTFDNNFTAFVYLDPLGSMPYVYLSSYGIDNGYNRYALSLGFVSDCPACTANGAYYQLDSSNNRVYYNKNSFQILCSGKDGSPGVGGQWDSRTGMPYSASGNDPGNDDMSNFHDRTMGIGAQ